MENHIIKIINPNSRYYNKKGVVYRETPKMLKARLLEIRPLNERVRIGRRSGKVHSTKPPWDFFIINKKSVEDTGTTTQTLHNSWQDETVTLLEKTSGMNKKELDKWINENVDKYDDWLKKWY